MRSIEYTYEDKDGESHTLDVEYTINPYRSATREQPEEGGDAEITSIKENGVEVELDEHELEKLGAYIEEQDEDDIDREDYDDI